MQYSLVVVLCVVLTLEKANALQCWRCSSDILPECRDRFNESEIIARRGGSSLYDSLQQNYQQGQRFDPNYDSQRNQRQYDPGYSGQRDQRQYDPGYSGQRDQRQYDPSYSGQRDQRQYDPAYSGQRNQRQYDPGYSGQPVGQQRAYDQNYNPNQRQFGQNFGSSSSLNNRLPELETCDENEARLNRKRTVCLKEIVRGNNYVSIIRRCESIPFEQTVGTCQPSVNRGLQLDFCEYCDYDGCNSATRLKMNIFLAAFIVFVLHFVNN
ncbi:unnamed protein product [Phaedon cochleariae]|uniref:Protein sleepless n=1 Tax=Phaedon cochleariae TaxID=80249 RepID=A0A9P0DCX8_PHACE|nr:unnamed protein product [Phaedon cochleariae]